MTPSPPQLSIGSLSVLRVLTSLFPEGSLWPVGSSQSCDTGWAVVSDSLLLPRVQSLQMHRELDLAHLCASTDLNEGRACRRAWQQRLNCQIQQITLQLLVCIFRCLEHRQCL